MVDRAKLIQAVQASRRRQGVDDDTYRAKLQRQFGVNSTKDLTDQQLIELRAEFNAGQPVPARRFRKAAPRKDQRYVYALWGELERAGGAQIAGRAGLQRFLEGQYGPSLPEMMTPEQTGRAAEALKAMIRRAKKQKEGAHG